MNPAPKAPDLSTYSGRFAARLKQLREKAGLTVQEFAQSLVDQGCDIRPRTYYNWEAGVNSPPYDLLPVLADRLTGGNVRTLMPQK